MCCRAIDVCCSYSSLVSFSTVLGLSLGAAAARLLLCIRMGRAWFGWRYDDRSRVHYVCWIRMIWERVGSVQCNENRLHCFGSDRCCLGSFDTHTKTLLMQTWSAQCISKNTYTANGFMVCHISSRAQYALIYGHARTTHFYQFCLWHRKKADFFSLSAPFLSLFITKKV